MCEKVRKKEKRWNKSIFVSLAALTALAVMGIVTVTQSWRRYKEYKDNSCITTECVTSSEFFVDIINSISDPCDNFFNFSCGGYERLSTLEEAKRLVDESLKLMITSRVYKDDPRSVKLQKKYYNACMNRMSIEADANRSMRRIFDELGGWPLLERQWNASLSWEQIVDKCIDLGLYYDWFVNIHNEASFKGSYDTLHIKPPDNAMHIAQDHKKSYSLLFENIENILSPTETVDVDPEEIEDIINFENDLYQVIVESQTNSTETNLTELRERFPSLPWKTLLKNVIVDDGTRVISSVDEYIPKLQTLLANTDIRVQSNYILWKITQSLWTFLSTDIRKAFEVYQDLRTMKKALPRDRYCYITTNTVFSYVSEAFYARQYAAERKQVRQIVDNIKTVLHDHINIAKWMNQTHKKYAISKLWNLNVIIGAPEEMYDEEKFDELLGVDKIDILHLNNTLDIVRAVDKSRDKYNLNFRKKKINYVKARLYQGIAHIQDTKYLPEENMMYLPTASLNGIFYSNNRPDSLNYGALGTIIAHELVHGFGVLDIVQYVDGKEHFVWANSTIESFFNATECVVNDCNDFNDNETEINCESTFEETFADYASIDLSYEAFKKVETSKNNQLPGLDYTSPQLFWISYASLMCNNLKLNDTEKLTHMLPYQRVMGSYRNSRHFAKDFSCSEGSSMNPMEKCSVL